MDESSLDMASRMRLIVFSRLRLRVDGLVMVVPSELWRPWPLRNLPLALSCVWPGTGLVAGLGLRVPSLSSRLVAPMLPTEPMLARGS